jgi:hypothetical protein
MTIDISNNKIYGTNSEFLKFTLVETGLNTNTAGRVKKQKSLLEIKLLR